MNDATRNPPSTPFANEAGLTPHQARLQQRLIAERPTDTLHRTRKADIGTAPAPQQNFVKVARISQDLKEIMHRAAEWHGLRADQRETLDMVQYCIARILSGEANLADTWEVIEVHVSGIAKQVRNK